MQGRVARVALTFAITAWALIFSGCRTTGGRISQHPEMYQSLSPRDQALVSQGQIRPGMTMDAVWLAWGTPDQKIPNNMDGRPTETWVYLRYETPPSYGGPYSYGPFRLVVYPAKVRAPLERCHFRQRQSRVLPIPHSTVTGVWLANSAVGMICSRHEALLFPSRNGVGCRGVRARSHQLFNATNANF